MGGLLARPVPRLTTIHLFAIYPYLLPAIVVSIITALAAISAYLFLSETLSSRSAKSRGSLKELLRHPPFQEIVGLYAVNNGVTFSWEAIYPLFAYTSPSLGGLGLQVRALRDEADGRCR